MRESLSEAKLLGIWSRRRYNEGPEAETFSNDSIQKHRHSKDREWQYPLGNVSILDTAIPGTLSDILQRARMTLTTRL